MTTNQKTVDDDIEELRTDIFARLDEYVACSEPEDAWWESVHVLAHVLASQLTMAAKDSASRARCVALIDHMRRQLDGVAIQ